MKTIAILITLLPSIGFACPIGMQSNSYGFGNNVCVSSNNEVKSIKGSLQNCPKGFTIDIDQWNNTVCSDGSITAYDLTKGCPNNFTQSWDSFGRLTCLDFNHHTALELVD